ncbi:outer membrane lipoprotein carrier protein LolA [Leptospira sp. WS92.C1]
MKLKLHFLFLIAFVFLSECTTTQIEEISFPDKGNLKFLPAKNAQAALVLKSVRELEEKNTSYSGEFSMRIENFVPKKESFSADGKIFYDQPSGKMYIELSDPFFGMIVSRVFTDGVSIRIKTASNAPQVLPMGDIVFTDPSGKKQSTIPFPILYSLLSNNSSGLAGKDPIYVNLSEKAILVKKPGEDVTFWMTDFGIVSVELLSKKSNLKAITKVQGTVSFPPKTTITRIVEPNTNLDRNKIEIRMKKVTLSQTIPDSKFQF